MTSQLIDKIYECSFLPDLWPEVFDDLAQATNTFGGLLFAANPNDGVLRWTSSPRVGALLEGYVTGGWLTRGGRFPRLVGARHSGFIREHDVFTDAELDADPTYRDYLRPRGMGWAAATALTLPTGDTLVFDIEQEYARGPIGEEAVRLLNGLRLHIARSVLVSARLQLERARAASEALALIGLPALVFGSGGKVLAANALIEAMNDHVHWRVQDRVTLKDPAADAQFQQAVATIETTGGGAVRSFAVRDAEATAAFVGRMIPIRRTARDVFAQSAGVLVLTPVTLPHAPAVELVQSLFDLTPAEARVARSLVAGDTVDEIAVGAGVSSNTVRSQVRGVLEKTGCRRQTEIVALLSGVALPPARRDPSFTTES